MLSTLEKSIKLSGEFTYAARKSRDAEAMELVTVTSI